MKSKCSLEDFKCLFLQNWRRVRQWAAVMIRTGELKACVWKHTWLVRSPVRMETRGPDWKDFVSVFLFKTCQLGALNITDEKPVLLIRPHGRMCGSNICFSRVLFPGAFQVVVPHCRARLGNAKRSLRSYQSFISCSPRSTRKRTVA